MRKRENGEVVSMFVTICHNLVISFVIVVPVASFASVRFLSFFTNDGNVDSITSRFATANS